MGKCSEYLCITDKFDGGIVECISPSTEHPPPPPMLVPIAGEITNGTREISVKYEKYAGDWSIHNMKIDK